MDNSKTKKAIKEWIAPNERSQVKINIITPKDSSKAEAAGGGGKGVSLSKPKASGYHKRRHGCDRKKRPTPARPTRLNFASMTEYIKGSIYDIRTIYQADQCITTYKAIAGYAGWTCTDPQYISIAIEKIEDVVPSIPEKKEYINNNIANLILSKDLDQGWIKSKNLIFQNVFYL